MELVKLSELKHGDVFLTKSSKMYSIIYHDVDGKTMVSRYTDEYYIEMIRSTSMVYHISGNVKF